jgi:hypothetical protein
MLVTAEIVPYLQILVTLMMKLIRSSERSVLTTATRRHAQEDGSLYSQRRENLKSYTLSLIWISVTKMSGLVTLTQYLGHRDLRTSHHFIYKRVL